MHLHSDLSDLSDLSCRTVSQVIPISGLFRPVLKPILSHPQWAQHSTSGCTTQDVSKQSCEALVVCVWHERGHETKRFGIARNALGQALLCRCLPSPSLKSGDRSSSAWAAHPSTKQIATKRNVCAAHQSCCWVIRSEQARGSYCAACSLTWRERNINSWSWVGNRNIHIYIYSIYKFNV